MRRYWGTPREGVVPPRAGLRARFAAACRVMVVVVVFCTSLWGADRALAWLTSAPVFAVRTVDVEGVRHAPVERLRSSSDVLGRNVFTLDLAAARARLLERPWVADATVRRVVPDAVHVRIVEEVPVAWHVREDSLALLDEQGDVLEVVDSSDLEAARERFSVPGVELAPESDQARLRDAAATLSALRRAEPQWALQVTRVVAAPDRITIDVPGHPRVHLGGPDSVDELSGWLVHRRALGREVGTLRAVDARWSGRLFLEPEKS